MTERDETGFEDLIDVAPEDYPEGDEEAQDNEDAIEGVDDDDS